MAKRLSKAGIVDGRLAQAYHVTQSIDAFTGVDAYDITLSGSLVVTGSTNISGTLGIPGFPDVSASLAAADDGFPYTGSAIITGSLIVTGSTNIDGLVTATSFSGDGSNITGVTGEWDGTLDGNAEITGSLILTQNLTASNISASGDIISHTGSFNYVSSSGTIEGNGFMSNGQPIAQFAVGAVQMGGATLNPVVLSGTSITLGIAGQNQSIIATSNITASANISASGDIISHTGSFNYVSSSGNIEGNGFFSNGQAFAFLDSGEVYLGGGNQVPVNLTGTTITVGNAPTTFIGNITASGNISASGDLFSNNLTVNGDTTISGSLLVSGSSTFTNIGPAELTGSTNILASEGSNLTLEVNESASFNFLTGGPNSGSFIVQTSPDTGNGELQVFTGQGTAVIASQNIPNHIFGIKYSSGSGASEGELSMAVGKRDLSNVGGANQNNFYVSYEPSGILTNAQGELEFFVGEHQNVGHGVLSVYRGGASGLTQTSSFAGYFSSSAFPNQQQYTRPFAISTLSQVNDSNPAFVINKNITDLTTSNFSVDYGGNVTANGAITASGAIAVGSTIPAASGYSGITAKFDGGAFFNITEETTSVFGIHDSPDGADILRIDTDPDQFIIDPINNGYNVGIGTASPAEKLTILGNVSASGNGIFKAGKPITTHTSSPISSSYANAGGYHIVGGNLTASIVLDSTAPVGAEYEFFQSSSTGQFLFESASGTTVISKNGSMRLAQQGSSAVLKKVSTTTFHLMGDLT